MISRRRGGRRAEGALGGGAVDWRGYVDAPARRHGLSLRDELPRPGAETRRAQRQGGGRGSGSGSGSGHGTAAAGGGCGWSSKSKSSRQQASAWRAGMRSGRVRHAELCHSLFFPTSIGTPAPRQQWQPPSSRCDTPSPPAHAQCRFSIHGSFGPASPLPPPPSPLRCAFPGTPTPRPRPAQIPSPHACRPTSKPLCAAKTSLPSTSSAPCKPRSSTPPRRKNPLRQMVPSSRLCRGESRRPCWP